MSPSQISPDPHGDPMTAASVDGEGFRVLTLWVEVTMQLQLAPTLRGMDLDPHPPSVTPNTPTDRKTK